MGIQPNMDEFFIQPRADTLAFVDMRSSYSQVDEAIISNVVKQCRKAHAFARTKQIPIAFVFGPDANNQPSERWIDGFEPQSMDQIFRRRKLSCFSSPYIEESVCSRGPIILAGFLGNGGGVASCIDAYLAKTQITLLSDALYDPFSQSIITERTVELFCNRPESGISIQTTEEWMEAHMQGLAG